MTTYFYSCGHHTNDPETRSYPEYTFHRCVQCNRRVNVIRIIRACADCGAVLTLGPRAGKKTRCSQCQGRRNRAAVAEWWRVNGEMMRRRDAAFARRGM